MESATAVVVDTSLRKEEGISESSWSIGDIDQLGIQTKIQMVDVIENPSTWARGVSELTEDAKFILRPDWTDVDEKVQMNILRKIRYMNRRCVTGSLSAGIDFDRGMTARCNTEISGRDNADAQMRQSSRPRQTSCSAIHPGRRLAWDLLAMLFLLRDLVMAPMQVFDLPYSGILFVTDLIVLVYWTIVIPVSMATAVYVNGKLETDLTLIFHMYTRGWFSFDLLLVCTGWMVCTDLQESGVLCLVRVARLFRAVKLDRGVRDVRIRINRDSIILLITVTKLIVFVMCLIHLLACAWYWVGTDSKEGWVFTQGVDEPPLLHHYLFAFQFAMARLHPANYSEDLELKTVRERIFAIVISMVAVAGGGVLLSSITNYGRAAAKTASPESEAEFGTGVRSGEQHIGSSFLPREEKRRNKPRQTRKRAEFGLLGRDSAYLVVDRTSL